MNKKLSQSILDTIQTHHVEPKQRWQFLVRRALLWIPGVIATLIGALSISVIIFSIKNSGWQYSSFTHGSFLAAVVQTLPYLWIIASVIFGSLAIQAVRETRHGYRYQATTLIFASIGISIILGVFGYFVGIGNYLDTQLSPRLGIQSTIGYQQLIWSNPEQGRLGGYVKKVGVETIRIKDFDGYLWNVTLEQVPDRETIIFNTVMDRNKQVRIVGYPDEKFPNTFHACVVMPFLKPNQRDGLRRGPPPRHIMDGLSGECRDALRR